MARLDLEHYYEQEREYLHKLGDEFGRLHPKVAGRLRLGKQGSTDPHVERLIDAVAFLNARIRRKLDDDFPELTDAFLDLLYPHFLAPIPSMAIVRLECDPALQAGYEVKRETLLETEPVDGEPLRFRTCYPTTVLPIKVAAAAALGAVGARAAGPLPRDARSVVRITLESRGEAPLLPLLFPKAGGAPRLRFFLNGEPSLVHELYELLFHDALEVAIATGPTDAAPQRLPPSALKQVGFGDDERMFPWSPRAHPAYRLLSEFFHFPAKFLFLDVTGFDRAKVAACGKRMELQVALRRSVAKVEQEVRTDTFALGCAPVVNLFPRRAEPLRLVAGEHEYRVVPDARRTRSFEVWSVDKVTAASASARPAPYRPLHGLDHSVEPGTRGRFYVATRRASARADADSDRGSDLWLSLLDLDHSPAAPPDSVLDVETTCFNRDLPAQLHFGGGQARMRFAEGGGPITRIDCLTEPTATRRPALRDGAAWRLVSHLHLSHLSLDAAFGAKPASANAPEPGAEAFRELLRLYDVEQRDDLEALIAGVTAVRSRPATLRIEAGGAPGFCRGNEIAVHLDGTRFPAQSLFLFGCVVERFLALHASINSFVRTVVVKEGKDGREEARYRWPARAGDRTVE